ncbi:MULTISPECIES: DUF3108 domain-containing protein [unclassified Carboxylicivirga]|uniref:DUF3108 domain-containing protein n=1 Tax=Carboxylicivirga TaxID=1628153 RepID=UPI003D342DE1
MQKLITAVLLMVLTMHVGAQCKDTNTAFKAGELVRYHAYYNWGFIWINAGQVSFEVEPTTVDTSPAYHLKAHGATYKSYDFLFKVRDTFETKVDTLHLEPYEFKRVTNEGSYHANYLYRFNREQRSIVASIQKEKEPQRDTTLLWKDCSFDLLTMVYKARNIDYEQYRENEKIPISMVVDGEIHDIYIRYLGKETIKNRDGRRFRCLKFSPLLVEGTIFKSGEDMTVWVTDDANRIPIVVEAKILIGSVKAVFVDAVNTRYPLSAEIK